MKTEKEFRTNAVVCLYRDYEERIKKLFKEQQYAANAGAEVEKMILIAPREIVIKETQNMFYEVYLCGIDEGKRQNKKSK
jgi:hypothetical protein